MFVSLAELQNVSESTFRRKYSCNRCFLGPPRDRGRQWVENLPSHLVTRAAMKYDAYKRYGPGRGRKQAPCAIHGNTRRLQFLFQSSMTSIRRFEGHFSMNLTDCSPCLSLLLQSGRTNVLPCVCQKSDVDHRFQCFAREPPPWSRVASEPLVCASTSKSP
ncbi:hypothetical protein DENSPDRAFT_570759 [Dentipellis sp. KUC8613]|nr:hypothetical protein DENSPDRAFT_570759 [Dentipellis sp. KUC8613]